MRFEFESDIKHLPIYDDPRQVETLRGTVEAANHDEAKKKAQSLAFDRCKQLEREQGSIYGYDLNNVRVTFKEEEPAQTMMATPEIISLIRWYLDRAIEGEKRAYAVYRDADETQRVKALSKLDFCGGKRHAWQQIAEKIAGIPAQSVIILDDAPSSSPQA